MFDLDLGTTNKGSTNLRRRVFLASAVSAIAGLALWQWRKPAVLEAAPVASGEPKEVTVVLFSDAGQRLKKERIAKVVKTEDEWRKQLSGNAFDITRHADTEIAFSGKYWDLHDKGTLPLHLLRQRALRFRHEIRVRHGMAQLLGADRRRKRDRDPRLNVRHGSHRGRLHRMRRAPRPRLRRRPRAYAISATA